MNSDSLFPAALEIECALPEFTPVPTARNRHDGWTPDCQRRFLAALMAMGTVGHAARAVGRSPVSAYNLLRRAGSESFARAWDFTIGEGRARAHAWAMERSINGYTTTACTWAVRSKWRTASIAARSWRCSSKRRRAANRDKFTVLHEHA